MRLEQSPVTPWRRGFVGAVLGACLLIPATKAQAQFATIGGGVLVSQRTPQPVGELHGQTPPFAGARAYLTMSWTDQSRKPTLITAVERPLLRIGPASAGVGAGLLWLEIADYRPYPLLVSSTVVPLPIPRTSFVVIGSVQPFQDFAWSVVLKAGVTVWFRR